MCQENEHEFEKFVERRDAEMLSGQIIYSRILTVIFCKKCGENKHFIDQI